MSANHIAFYDSNDYDKSFLEDDRYLPSDFLYPCKSQYFDETK